MSGLVVLILRLLLAISLYAFLGWALFTLWRDLRTRGEVLASRKIPAINLMVQSGKRPPYLRHFNQPEILMGRDSHCDVHLQDDTVSVRHARLTYHHGQWWLEDLGSTNGTRLNNERLTTPTVVIGGDKIECGKISLTVDLGADLKNPPTTRIDKPGDDS